jgi:hypothetical protein
MSILVQETRAGTSNIDLTNMRSSGMIGANGVRERCSRLREWMSGGFPRWVLDDALIPVQLTY